MLLYHTVRMRQAPSNANADVRTTQPACVVRRPANSRPGLNLSDSYRLSNRVKNYFLGIYPKLKESAHNPIPPDFGKLSQKCGTSPGDESKSPWL
jgi:hypothetical protein